MAAAPKLTDELKAKIGTILEPVVHDVERGAIRRFAQAAGDSNPLYTDEEYARSTRHGGIVAPPGFFGWPAGEEIGPEKILSILDRPFENVLNGGTAFEFLRPIRPDDVLVSYVKLADVYEKSRESGSLLFVVLEVIYKNQADQEVAKARHTFMFY